MPRLFVVTLQCGTLPAGDLTFDLWGYIFALLSCTSQAAYLLMVEFQVTILPATSGINKRLNLYRIMCIVCSITTDAPVNLPAKEIVHQVCLF
jgi:solute carrier family 35 protein